MNVHRTRIIHIYPLSVESSEKILVKIGGLCKIIRIGINSPMSIPVIKQWEVNPVDR